MGGICSVVCASIREEGCWYACCPCIAKYVSAGKCFDMIPWWPMIALILMIVSGALILVSLSQVADALGVSMDPIIVYVTQATGGVLILLNLLFGYSVTSNKMRIHNVHCCAEGCRGYRIKDAQNCCSALLRCVCKIYNVILKSLSVIATLLAILVCTALSWFSGSTLFLAWLCRVSTLAVDKFLDEAVRLQGMMQSTPVSFFSDFISITNTTSASSGICSDGTSLLNGGTTILICAALFMLGQVIMLTSFHVVAEVSWRHMKDLRRAEEVYVGQEMSHQQAAAGAGHRAMSGSGNYNEGSGKFNCASPNYARSEQGSQFGLFNRTHENI